MKHLFQSDLTKTLLYFILTLVAAAALAPWPYNVGKIIEEIAETRTTSETAKSVASWCAQANFAHFFLLSLLGCALILAGPFISWLQLGSRHKHTTRPWSLRLPRTSLANIGQPLVRNPRKWFYWTTGFLLAGSLLALMDWLFLFTGWFTFNHPVDWLPAVTRSLVLAFLLSVTIEWVFRGIFLGIFLHSLRPALAIIYSAALYSCLHFLFPPDNFQFKNADQYDAGFRFLAETTLHLFSYPGYLFGFISLFFSGLILAYARYQTASLSLSIGLQTGWLFIYLLSQEIISFTHANFTKIEVIIGPDRRSGLIPLCILIATGLLIHVFVQLSTRNRRPT